MFPLDSHRNSSVRPRRSSVEPLEQRLLMARHTRHHTQFMVQTNLVSDQAGQALKQDTNLVNAWGIAAGGQSPFWVNGNGTGTSEAIFNTGFTPGATTPKTITIPSAANNVSGANPTGIVFNNTTSFQVTNNGSFGAANYLFASEDGSISAWRFPASGSGATTAAVRVIDNGAASNVYKGLAIDTIGNSPFLYAADFRHAKVDVFSGTFAPAGAGALAAGAFTDNTLPAGFAPFNITTIDGNLYVTYAMQNAQKHDDVAGAGNGFIDVYTSQGVLLSHFASHGSLNSPWGMTVAPSTFGQFAGDILVGNFGDGKISAFSKNGRFDGTLSAADGNPVVIDGLWGITFGNGVNAGNANTLYFAAGPGGESHGLFGALDIGVRRRTR